MNATTGLSGLHAETGASQRAKLLLVDDNAENLIALEAVLESLGQDLVKASSGFEALRHLLEDDFAAILLDVKMPEMDGFETAALIRSRKRSQHTPILFLTGYKNEEHLFRGYDLGAVDFLFKPIVPEILQSKVSVFVELSRNSELLKRQASELKKAEQKFRAVLEAAPDAMVITTPEGAITLVNSRTETLFGLNRSEILKNTIDFLVPDWPASHRPAGSYQSSDGTRQLFGIRADGATFPIEISCNPLQTEDGEIVIGSIRDITDRIRSEEHIRQLNVDLERKVNERTAELMQDISERKRAEQALRESEQRLRVAIDAAQLGLWSIELATGRVTWHDRTAHMFGTNSASTDRAVWEQVVHPEDRERWILEFQEAISGKTDYDTLYRTVLPNGSIRWMAARGQVLRDEHGVPIRLVGVVQDITERRQAEESIRHKAKLESLGILAGGIAHDFNNLLTGIMANASLLLDDLAPDSRDRPLLENVVKASERAAQLTRQMLAYSGRGRFIIEPVVLSKQVREITALLQASIPKTVNLRLDVSDYIPLVELDVGQLQQLVMNLVINGAEAIGSGGGSVTVSTRVVEISEQDAKEGFLADEIKPGQFVLLEVRDTGQGMDEETKSKIFDPFFTTKFTGRGLGLAAVIGIVRGHKGAIKVMSKPGEGTTFLVYFPVAEAPAPPPAKRIVETSLGSGTILIVDDEEVVRRTARASLERYGYKVVLAENGKEGVDVFRSIADQVSLVILDMTMPVMSGEEALKALQQIRPDVRVMASSGYDEIEALTRFGHDVTGFIQKPYSSSQLAEKVKTLAVR